MHDFANDISSREQVDAVFLDLSRAFDMAPNHLPLKTLQCVGVAPRLVSWITAYLKNRTQFVEINKWL